MRAGPAGLVLGALLVSACASGAQEVAPPAATTRAEATPSPVTPRAEEATEAQPLSGRLDDLQLSGQLIASGLAGPVLVTSAPGDDRVFVVEQAGRVSTLPVDATPDTEPAVFLDLTDRVRAGNEQGLLGLAFHPDFAANGRLFVHYTGAGGETVLEEYATREGTADRESARAVLEVAQPAGNHNGGQVAFGPDGMLYLALGDGGGAGDRFGNGQRPDTLLGTILRLDVDGGAPYVIPPDNPFANGTDEAGVEGAPEVWHYGLRNPWRFSFDDGLLYIGDVGQGAQEEIDVVPANRGGLNFGWPIAEGTACFDPPDDCPRDGLTDPVVTYGTRQDGCAVIGGHVYRGRAIPELEGHFFYSDVCSGLVRSFVFEDGVPTDERDWTGQLGDLDQRTGDSVSGYAGPTSFGVGPDAELYLTTAGGNVFRLARR